MGSNSWGRFCAGSTTCCAPAGAEGFSKSIKLIRHGNGGLVVVDQAEGNRKRWLSLWSTGQKDHASSRETKFKLEMAQSITDAISTGRNGGMWWNNGVFCNELINYAVRIFNKTLYVWSLGKLVSLVFPRVLRLEKRQDSRENKTVSHGAIH